MAGDAAAALATVANWLGEGRLVIGDGFACFEHVAILRNLRIARRWDMLTSVRMLVSIHAGNVAWIHSTLHMVRVDHHDMIETLELRLRVAGDEVQRHRTQAARDISRIDAIEEELRIREEAIDDLRVEVRELNEALVWARRADRPEPDPEPEP
jgi:hypothetical protein